MNRLEKEHSRKEDLLKQEISDLQQVFKLYSFHDSDLVNAHNLLTFSACKRLKIATRISHKELAQVLKNVTMFKLL